MPSIEEDKSVMRAGDMPPEVVEETEDTKSTEKESQTFVDGKYKSAEELESAYKNLEKKMGEDSAEKSALRQNIDTLTSQFQQLKSDIANTQNNEDAKDYATQLNGIMQELSDGNLDVEEAMKQSNLLTAEMAAGKATEAANKTFSEKMKERDAMEAERRFNSKYTDFKEIQGSGALEAIKQDEPMHDDFSAYFVLKAQQAEEKGKKTAQLADEAGKKTETVLKKPGAGIRTTNNKPLRSEQDMKSSMMNALKDLGAT